MVVAPFVVVASGPMASGVRAEAAETVAWARDLLRADFFAREPGSVITVWVFPDESSYMSGTSALLGTIPTTPYGFYSPCQRALVTNAGLGYGTLVHEMVHAYMSADFPGAPTWMNEGLASLFEAPREVDGHMRGAVNWRLAELQRAIAAHRAPSFDEMAKGGRGDFSGKRGSLFYATARYLCFYLQERGLLQRFYRVFRARVNDDPTGLVSLQDVAIRDLRTLRADWERFVGDLRHPALR